MLLLGLIVIIGFFLALVRHKPTAKFAKLKILSIILHLLAFIFSPIGIFIMAAIYNFKS